MHRNDSGIAGAVLLSVSLLVGSAGTLHAQAAPLPVEQLPLAKDISVPSGQTVTPAFEGWYENPDGSYSIVFGYYSRNSEEVVRVPIGPDNIVEGVEEGDWWQPTRFEPGRHWGVFAVRVPEDFDDEVVWKLTNRGETFEIPGHLDPRWEIDAISGDAMGNRPPKIRFRENGRSGEGPAGIQVGPRQARVGEPLQITVWGSDDGVAAGMLGAGNTTDDPFEIHWMKHSGPGVVSFDPRNAEIPVDGGSATTEVVFTEPGDYMLRVRANDASGRVGGGHAQCCWTNGYVEVQVSESSRSAP